LTFLNNIEKSEKSEIYAEKFKFSQRKNLYLRKITRRPTTVWQKRGHLEFVQHLEFFENLK
jgi:hypothetical protein